MKNAVLGKKYELSLVFIGKARAQALNRKYRKRSYTPNVLAFPLSKEAGEIFICPTVAASEAKSAGMSARHMTAYLFIHALLHLEGLPHGATMERKERELLRRFGIASGRS
ncbi:MAG TPA: rRNA maturation RNase YbeY [Candidatus Paceibacterota bacterium]|jgi:probable rRNA maturation factor